MDVQNLMDKLLKAVSFQFKDDKTAPGITVSSLKRGYYASVVRYELPFAKGKVIVCKAEGTTLEQALQNVAKTFLKQVRPVQNPIDELSNVVDNVHKSKKVVSDEDDDQVFFPIYDR